MGSSNYSDTSRIDIDIDFSTYLIDGRKNEYGDVYEGKNKLADFIFDHRFIFVDCPDCNHYKIYEWTKKGLKMFASTNYPIYKKHYLGSNYVKEVYRIAKLISEEKDFSLTSFNCKDWVKEFKYFFE